MTTALDVLVEGRRRIVAGWNKGMIKSCRDDGSPTYCARGATVADYNMTDTTPMFEALMFLHREVPSRYEGLVDYNDRSQTTKEDILALYDRAIASAQKETHDTPRDSTESPAAD